MVTRAPLAVAVVVACVQSAWYFDRLPDVLASHFDGAGVPNGWSGKPGFFAMYLGIVIIVALIFLITDLAISRDPGKRLSLPRRDYWLDPERIAETTAYIRGFIAWMGVLSLVLAIVIVELVIRANLQTPIVLSAVIFRVLEAYFGIILVAVAWFCLQFFMRGRR